MAKHFKTKEYVLAKKKKVLSKSDLSHIIKKQSIISKKTKEEKSEKQTEKSNAQVSAVDDVEMTASSVGYESAFKVKETAKKAYSSYRNKKSYRNNSSEIVDVSSANYKDVKINEGNQFLKRRFKINKSIQSSNSLNFIKKTYDFIQKGFNGIKNTVSSVSSLISIGSGTVLLVVITLFIGVFASFSDNSVYGYPLSELSEEVLSYTEVIEKYAAQYKVEEYLSLIQAIMMQETKGIGDDPMDSSLFPYNSNYPNKITDSEYSIDVGIHYLADCLKEANVSSLADTELIYLAIQGYDFGIDYIKWAKENFDEYSKTNAQLYADQQKAIQEIEFDGDTNYVNHVMQYIGFGFGTFRLEPNFDNHLAWANNNPYSANKLYGQCTWFAWGRFYELYGFSPGFTGDGWNCAKQLVNAHPDQFELSSNPQVGAIFSCIGRNHVGIVVGWDGVNITIQEGNLDGITNTFSQAKKDWQTVTYNIDQFRRICDGVIFAIKKK